MFVGTEHGVWVTIDGGGHWVPLKNNLPTVPVHDMVIHPRDNDLVIGTHGRGFWILDDISMLAELSSDGLWDSEAQLFSTRPALQFNPANRGREWNGDNYYRAPNPPRGAIIDYWVNPAVMEVTGRRTGRPRFATGDLRRRRRSRSVPGACPRGPTGTGSHRVTWDMRYAPTYVAPEGEGGTVGRDPGCLPGRV